jgi:hypothetical protein
MSFNTTAAWSTDRPAFPCWYTASSCEPRCPTFARFWNGAHWSAPIHRDDMADPMRLTRARLARGETQSDIVWQPIELKTWVEAELDVLTDDLWAADDAAEAEAKEVTAESAEASLRRALFMYELVTDRMRRLGLGESL